MLVLVIPDIHLKPWIFNRAAEIMQKEKADRAVCLMDIPDDWNQQFNLTLYEETFEAAQDFLASFPETLWCWGNHDVSYLWQRQESGYSAIAQGVVARKLFRLQGSLPDEGQMAFVHRIDSVLFCHGGLTESFVDRTLPEIKGDSVDTVIREINRLGPDELWQNGSPLWYRPQYHQEKMYGEGSFLQVVGHTPVREIGRMGSVISCDVFSTDRSGIPIGTREFLLLDTETWACRGIQ